MKEYYKWYFLSFTKDKFDLLQVRRSDLITINPIFQYKE